MAQQQATLTISGYVGSDPVNFSRNENSPACSLRIGSTTSYYHSEERQWKDRPTTWMTVKAYKSLAANVLKSVHKGDAIVVCGNLNTESWHKDGEDRSRVVLEATAIGHDLNRGISAFTKYSYNRGRTDQSNNSKYHTNQINQENRANQDTYSNQDLSLAMKNPMANTYSMDSSQENDSQEYHYDAESSAKETIDFGSQVEENHYDDIEGGVNDFQKVLIELNIKTYEHFILTIQIIFYYSQQYCR